MQEKETNRFRFFSDTARLNKSCRRGRLEATGGMNRGHAVDAARGDRKLGAIGCRGTSWSEKLDDKKLRGALGSAIGTERIPVF